LVPDIFGRTILKKSHLDYTLELALSFLLAVVPTLPLKNSLLKNFSFVSGHRFSDAANRQNGAGRNKSKPYLRIPNCRRAAFSTAVISGRDRFPNLFFSRCFDVVMI
jgi:hypothetical protein